jgi:hypothetical protein
MQQFRMLRRLNEFILFPCFLKEGSGSVQLVSLATGMVKTYFKTYFYHVWETEKEKRAYI